MALFSNLRPLSPYLRKYRKTFSIGAVCVLFNNGIWILFRSSSANAPSTTSTARSPLEALTYAGMLLAVAAAKAIFQFLTRWILIGDLARNRVRSAQRPVQAPRDASPTASIQRTRTGDIMARATNDLNAVRMLRRPRHYVHRQHPGVHRRRAGLHAQHQPQVDVVRPSCRCPSSAS